MTEKKKAQPEIVVPPHELCDNNCNEQGTECGEKQELPKNNTIDFGPYSTARYYNPGCWCEGGSYYCGC